MSRSRILFILLVAAGIVIFAWRHHSLRELQVEQNRLRGAAPDTPAAATAHAPAAEAATNAALSAEERSELLRLRGQIAPLRQELAQANNQLARASRSQPRPAANASPGEPVVTREEMVQKMSRGKQWMVALLIYASDHNDQLPGKLDAAAAGLQQQIGSMDEFEYLLGETNIGSIRFPATTIALREQKPWRDNSGRWARAYGFADGHVEIAHSDTGDFTDWETAHRPPENPPPAQ